MDRFLSTKLWLYGLFWTVISGAAGAGSVVLVDPEHFNLGAGLPKLLEVAAAMGLIALINYLQKHPLPEWAPGDPERRKTD